MALNKLKKWIGTQAMTAFFDQLNDNVDATNAHMAESAKKHIAEAGGNDDGAYIKFDDGTMICRYRTPIITTNVAVGNIYMGAASSSWTLPAQFDEIHWIYNYGIERIVGNPFGMRAGKPGLPSELNGIALYSADNGAQAHIVLTAIGRWK